MPRIRPFLLRKAHLESPNLASLLPACRDLSSARNELRWIREHVSQRNGLPRSNNKHGVRRQVSHLCRLRGNGVPLQYLLGTQPFGPLEILCRPGVLIPRPETEAYTFHLARVLRQAYAGNHDRPAREGLKVLDVCTGTGCIALGLYASCRGSLPGLQVVGVDVSHRVVGLARLNLDQAVQGGHLPDPTVEVSEGQNSRLQGGIAFVEADVFDSGILASLSSTLATKGSGEDPHAPTWDVLVSNPPYISQETWASGRGQMTHSVKKYEPRLALVPNQALITTRDCSCLPEDIFYARLLDLAAEARSEILLFEVGDDAQALRVARMVAHHAYTAKAAVELWRDAPDAAPGAEEGHWADLERAEGEVVRVPTKGSGCLRSVFVRTR